MPGTFLLLPSGNGQFGFLLKDGNNEILLHASESYPTKQACKFAISIIKLQASCDRNYTRYNDVRARPTFYLRAISNHVIGVGESFLSMAARDKRIELVKQYAPGAPVIDEAELT